MPAAPPGLRTGTAELPVNIAAPRKKAGVDERGKQGQRRPASCTTRRTNPGGNHESSLGGVLLIRSGRARFAPPVARGPAITTTVTVRPSGRRRDQVATGSAPTDTRPVVTASSPPPPVSGGTILITHDGKRALSSRTPIAIACRSWDCPEKAVLYTVPPRDRRRARPRRRGRCRSSACRSPARRRGRLDRHRKGHSPR